MLDSLATTEWTKVTLAECCDEIAQRIDDPAESGFDRFVGLEHLQTGETTIRSWGSTEDVTSSMKLFKTGDVIVARRNVYLRRAARADFDGVCSGDGIVLRGNPEVCLPELLPFLLNIDGFWSYVTSQADGTMSKRITVKRLLSYEFPLPPLEEQRRIVKVLQAVRQEKEALKALQRSLEIVKTSLANATFTNDKWPTSKLGEVLEYASDGPFGSKIKSEHYSERGVRVIRLQNIDINKWNDKDKAFVSNEYFKQTLKNFEVRTGDVVVAGLGDERIPAGRACVIPHIATPALNKADLFCLRPKNNIRPSFLSIFLNSSVGLRQSAQFSQGTTRMRLNLGNIKRMLIPVPTLDEQIQIESHMMAVLNTELEVRARSQKIKSLDSILLNHSMRWY